MIKKIYHKEKWMASIKKTFGTRFIQNPYRFISLMPAFVFLIWLFWPMRDPFPDDYSTLVLDRKGRILRVYLASDEQYRFPMENTVLPEKYVTTLLIREDKRFYTHVGIDPLAFLHAVYTNLKAGKRIRGGSTLPMQITRLSKPKKRTYLNKFFECLTALRLSIHYSKKEILQMYAAHVPMGGNIVGIQAASQLYYGKPITELTWAEAALFVILPNAPSSMHVFKGRDVLLQKRNILIHFLKKKGIIDKKTADISCLEPLPDGGKNIPFNAPHFSRYVTGTGNTGRAFFTTLDLQIQQTMEDAADLVCSGHCQPCYSCRRNSNR